MVCNVICCFGCEFKQLIAKMQVFLRKKEEKRVERDRGRNRERDLERVPCCIVLKKVYRFILSDTLMTGDVEPS